MVPGTVSALETPLVFDHDQSLVGANFSNRSDLRGAIFSKSNCKFASFEGSDLTNAQLDDANFQEANLQGAVAVNAMATKAKFQRANLKDVGT
ncbi:Thylakoid lumenal 17.4 kDa protein, chloroplastic [Gracilariopsis chorda]|uniref:Thylakoid lumenal 17.4 kDa protein, chloroplastic n=1 Tax=Gracilariopsis chorda TaxID=448386 RepID=A0A2V3IND6_9FLOR|nr:Thylakoid lumenal 17.4 kDa protein, chloroplastic [Gracilariopsis chorda]|eukprot:PXF43577.1 Thylakoid lumenal 17.4 kDa protein, chloroplastic [Gracilariopsis chorda]